MGCSLLEDLERRLGRVLLPKAPGPKPRRDYEVFSEFSIVSLEFCNTEGGQVEKVPTPFLIGFPL
jgi:hypothetical protein